MPFYFFSVASNLVAMGTKRQNIINLNTVITLIVRIFILFNET